MSRNFFIIHGIYGSPDENWFPWLKKELENRRHTVHVPHLPTTEPLQEEGWTTAFEPYLDKLTPDSIVIGHSLGCAFLCSLLETHTVRSAYFVAPAWGIIDHELDPIIATVAQKDFKWSHIAQHCSDFRVFHSDNDPYLALERGTTLAKHLGVEPTIISGAGHFNAAAGYTTFSLLLEEIEKASAN